MTRLVKGPVVLVVLDGWGLREEMSHNGIALAKTPNFDSYVKAYPFTQLLASGEAVGLPEGQIGNSEVGHLTIGSGQVLYQDLVRIHKSIASEEFYALEVLRNTCEQIKEKSAALHVMGILSPGGVHGHEDHFLAVIESAIRNGVERIVLHPFLDGRDTPPASGKEALKKLEDYVANHPQCVFGSISGRYYSMDRDTNWERTNKAFQAIFNGVADHVYAFGTSPSLLLEERYSRQEFDELSEPIAFMDKNNQPIVVGHGDGIVFTNFRVDRVKQLSTLICEEAKKRDLIFVTMTHYGQEFDAHVMFGSQDIPHTLASALSSSNMKQLHVAETEKYPHATYYLNGWKRDEHAGETHVLVPSRKDIKTHDQAPEMRAREISEEVIKRLRDFDFVFINYANPDMVGHTANQKAIITAVETVDRELGRIVDATLALDGAVLAIADHGNAEMMVDPITGEPHTAHTTNPVPCILIARKYQPELRHDTPGLSDVAPTILALLGVGVPESMTGTSIIL